MAKGKNKKAKPVHKAVRNWTAVAAHFRNGGAQQDRRTKRNRTRSEQKRRALNDGW
jgi:hypothetical protein